MICRYGPKDALDKIALELTDKGVVIIEDLLDLKVIDNFNADLRREFDRVGHLFQNTFNGHNTLRVGGVAKYSSQFPALLMHPSVLALADYVLKPNCDVYQVGSTTAIEILPGEDAQVLHRDDTCYPSHLLPFELQISALWALDDFTLENGATRVILKGSETVDQCQTHEKTILQAVMPKGSVVVYLGSTLHGGGANRSEHSRKALVNTYCLGWLRQEENQYLTLTKEEVAIQTEPVQRMLGYQAHGPYLGVWPEDPDGLWYES